MYLCAEFIGNCVKRNKKYLIKIMKLKFVLASILLFGAVSASLAQSDDSDEENVVAPPHYSTDDYVGFGGKKNDVKLDFNFGWFISEFVDRHGEGHRGIFGGGMSLMYEHVFNKGYGFGVNGIYEQGDGGDIKTVVLAPSFVYYGSKDKWTYGYSIGLGFGRFSMVSSKYGDDDGNGLGYFVQANIERRISKHFGFGAGLRVLNITASKPKNNSYYDTHIHGTGSVRFTIGPRFYF